MFDFIRRLFGKKPAPAPVDEAAAAAWYEEKSKLLEATLGPEHDHVMHAIIPFAIGGGLDLYYYPNGVAGTAVATKELSEAPGEGPKNKAFDAYELVMFTRHPLDMEQARQTDTPFGAAHGKLNTILNIIARYAGQATLNPYETMEFPADMEPVGGKCLVLDAYGSHADTAAGTFGVMAIIEVFRSEMEYAREHGGAALLSRLTSAGHYPYSDMEREPVA